jgi:hypothetical protein
LEKPTVTVQYAHRPARREPRDIPPAVFQEPRYTDGLPYETTMDLPGADGSDDEYDD